MTKFFILIAIFVALAANQVDADSQSNSTCVLKPIGEASKPELNHFNFNDCILANFSSSIELVSKAQRIELNNGTVNTEFSRCSPNEVKLVVDFNCTQLAFHIKKMDNFIVIDAINGFSNLNITNGTTRDHVIFSANVTDKAFNISNSDYYKCSSTQSLSLKSSNGTDYGSLTISNFAWEAFREPNSKPFYKHENLCSLDSQPSENDWVRVAVFICLVALVVIVLVAYFIGRRRWTERSSYESV